MDRIRRKAGSAIAGEQLPVRERPQASAAAATAPKAKMSTKGKIGLAVLAGTALYGIYKYWKGEPKLSDTLKSPDTKAGSPAPEDISDKTGPQLHAHFQSSGATPNYLVNPASLKGMPADSPWKPNAAMLAEIDKSAAAGKPIIFNADTRTAVVRDGSGTERVIMDSQPAHWSSKQTVTEISPDGKNFIPNGTSAAGPISLPLATLAGNATTTDGSVLFAARIKEKPDGVESVSIPNLVAAATHADVLATATIKSAATPTATRAPAP